MTDTPLGASLEVQSDAPDLEIFNQLQRLLETTTAQLAVISTSASRSKAVDRQQFGLAVRGCEQSASVAQELALELKRRLGGKS